MKGLLGDRLSEAQYTYLQNNVASWYNTVTVVFCNNTFSNVFVDWYDNATGYWEMDQITRDGTVSHSRSNDPTNYRATVWNGEPGNYLYLYGDNGHVAVSSYTTLGFGLIPAVRNVLDTQDLFAIKDTDWLWTNLNNVLGYLKGLGLKIFEDKSYNDIMELSVEWDSNMSWRLFSPYMIGWVKGQINELNIANYLYHMYGDKWDKMYEAMTAEYNPIENYNMHQVEHIDDVKDETTTNDGNSSSLTQSDGTNSRSGSSERDISNSGNNANDVYAFNSENPSHDSRSNNSSSTSDDVSTSDSGTSHGETTTEGSTSNVGSYNTDNDRDEELTRTGNIGVTTSQQLVEAELELRKNIILGVIRDDITYVMTLPYYGGKY